MVDNLNSVQTPAPTQPPAQQQTAPANIPTPVMPMQPPMQSHEIRDEVKSSLKACAKIVIIGIFLLAASAAIAHMFDPVQQYPEGTFDEYDKDNNGVPDSNGDWKQLDKDQDSWYDFRTTDAILTKIATYIYIVGMLMIEIGLIAPVFYDKTIDSQTRLGLLIAAGLVISRVIL